MVNKSALIRGYRMKTLIRSGWMFFIDPTGPADKRRKHHVALRFLALNGKKNISYRCAVAFSQKSEVRTWVKGLRKFADMMEDFIDGKKG